MHLFQIPIEMTEDSNKYQKLANQMVDAWRTDGVFYIIANDQLFVNMANAFQASKQFMEKPLRYKKKHINDLAYSGYFNGGEEYEVDQLKQNGESINAENVIGGQKPNLQNWESFAISKDLPLDDQRVLSKWPCHGPVPWPNEHFKNAMVDFMNELESIGNIVIRLIALGLGLNVDVFSRICKDGWHRMQTLHYPEKTVKLATSLSSHTDEALLVLLAQDNIGGLYVRPPIEGEARPRNWLETESSSGLYQNDEPWNRVIPLPGTLVCFPGDIFQLISDGQILATMHKVMTGPKERYSFAFFYEPNFNALLRPLVNSPEAEGSEEDNNNGIFYGEFFTKLFMNIYPNRITTKRMLEEKVRLRVMAELSAKAREGI